MIRGYTYRQKGSSMEVHSFMNWMEPPGSAEMSRMRNGDSVMFGSTASDTIDPYKQRQLNEQDTSQI